LFLQNMPGPSKPRSQPAEAYLAIVRTAEQLQRDFVELFKTQDLSPAQYNVLRILRGAGPVGVTCSDVANSLIQHDPDVTRLLDRLERRGLIERGRDSKDRRVVRTTITTVGEALLATLDEPVESLHARQLGHVSGKRLGKLVALLEDARSVPG
jgi:DNA-binding MarR family transcriptional regulator